MKKFTLPLMILAISTVFTACSTAEKDNTPAEEEVAADPMQEKVDLYSTVTLEADISHLSEKQREMIPLLIEASDIMDELFWFQAFGGKDSLLEKLDGHMQRFAQINYGPWDRLNDNEPFVPGYGPKPEGANFYPLDMTKAEFEAANIPDKASQYTFIRRGGDGTLEVIWYNQMFPEKIKRAAGLLRQASALAEDAGFKRYLELRATALETDKYYESDVAWMQMKNNYIDVVIGPIETYEDKLYGYKAAYESYILIKDKEWSERLSEYVAFLPMLQRELPVPIEFKREDPGTDSDLNAYDVVYYAGDCNAGSKTIAINLPNDEKVQNKYGSRRLQLKNAMRAKFDEILVPIADVLIDPAQRQHITFDAFFANTMFHEVAHGLGIKNTITGKGTVREALKEQHSALEEGKADVLGLYMITKLYDKGELKNVDLMDYYTTFLAGIFRSVRFGASSAHGKANMVRFNYFKDMGAFEMNEQGQYRVNREKFRLAIDALSEDILTIQGRGDHAAAVKLTEEKGMVDPQLQAALNSLTEKNIPVDIVFNQGWSVLAAE